MRKYLLALFCSCGFLFSSAQVTLRGTVVDEVSGENLIGASVLADDGTGTITDIDGAFSLNVPQIPTTLVISYVGYASKEIKVENSAPLSIVLVPSSNIMETMTVTASKYERRLSESTVSVDVVKPSLISNTNTVDIDAVLDKVPGVQMVDGQANIRGGSGFSYGAGSRVMLLIDDVPALQVDAGFPNWGDIPVENIEQVEILKGAASSLYGSAALNGIINIKTGSPSSTPQTKISGAYLVFDDAADQEAQWWGDTTRYQYTLSVLHKQRFGKLDVSASLWHNTLESFNRNTFQNRDRFSLKTKYQLGEKAFLNFNGLLNKNENGDFFVWANSFRGKYEAFANVYNTQNNLRYFLDPSLNFEDEYGNNHKVLLRYHYINNDNNNDQGNTSKTFYGEYQLQRNVEAIDAIVTVGGVGINTNTSAELFGDTTFNTKMFAGYLQLEKKLFDKLNFSAGTRYEHIRQRSPEVFMGQTIPDGLTSDGALVSRLGLSYEYAPFSSLRASWGQGFRFPTITERFISTNFGGFQIRPNVNLQAETGWTTEIGIKQGMQFGPVKGFVDVSVFRSRYQDMLEFTFQLDGVTPAFTSENIGNTEINGFEIGLFNQVKLGEVTFDLYGGYTYIDPKYQDFEENDAIRESLSSEENVLKYRVQHNLKGDLQVGYKGLMVGLSLIRNSHMQNIDRVLETIEVLPGVFTDLLGVGRYRRENDNGWQRFDARLSYQLADTKMSFLVNNVFNREISVRPGILEGPRSFTLRLDHTFNWE